jgi:hypothetical protein
MSCSAALFFLLLGCEAENTVLGTDEGGDDVTDMTDESEPDTTPEDGDGDDEPDTDTSPGDGTTDDGGEDDGGSNGDECDLTGTWAVRVWTINEAFGLSACASNYYYYEIVDNGDTFEATRGNSCGYQVVKGATVRLNNFTLEALLRRSDDSLIQADDSIPNDANNSTTGRTGTYKPDGNGGCEFSIERWWAVRGAEFETYLPAKEDFATETIDSMEQKIPMPTEESPEGNEDWEGDSAPGITQIAEGSPSGRRYVTQRDWNGVEPFSVVGDNDKFEVRMQFNNIEGVVGLGPNASTLLSQTSLAAATTDQYGHVMTWKRMDEDMPEGEENFDAMMTYCEDMRNTLRTRSQDIFDNEFSTACCELPENIESGDKSVDEVCLLPL